MVIFLRGMLLCKSGNPDLVDATAETLAAMQDCAYRLQTREILSAVQAFDQAARDRRAGWQPQLPLELAFIGCLQLGGDAVSQAPKQLPQQKSEKATASPAVSDTSSKVGVSQASTPGDSLDLSEVNLRWKETIAGSRAYHHTLPALLQWCRPDHIQNETLWLGVRQEFAISKLDTPNMRAHLEAALTATTGHALQVRFIRNEASSRDEEHDVVEGGVVEMGVELGARPRERD